MKEAREACELLFGFLCSLCPGGRSGRLCVRCVLWTSLCVWSGVCCGGDGRMLVSRKKNKPSVPRPSPPMDAAAVSGETCLPPMPLRRRVRPLCPSGCRTITALFASMRTLMCGHHRTPTAAPRRDAGLAAAMVPTAPSTMLSAARVTPASSGCRDPSALSAALTGASSCSRSKLHCTRGPPRS